MDRPDAAGGPAHPAGTPAGQQQQHPPPTTLATMDQDELLAVRALEDLMHGSTGGSSSAATSTGGASDAGGGWNAGGSSATSVSDGGPAAGASSSSTTAAGSSAAGLGGGGLPGPSTSPADPKFVARVSSLPVVNPLLRAYSTATGGSRVVKYVEGTLGAVGGSLIGEERRAVWDEWGCRTLDRVGLGTPTDEAGELPPLDPAGDDGRWASTSSSSLGGADLGRPRGRSRRRDNDDDAVVGADQAYTGETARDFTRETERAFLAPSASQSTAPTTRSASPASTASRTGSQDRYGHGPRQSTSTSLLPAKSPARRPSPPSGGNRWSNMLVEAGMTAGGIGAAVSEESMKSLKYCLQWLQYATAHIDHQIHLLRDFLQTLSSPTTPQNALISPAALHTLSRIKADVVETIRKVVGVVSTYAGGALPEAARRRVKGLVLSLPERWAMANPAGGQEGDREEGPTIVAAKAATGRVLSLAVEGLDMLSGCAGVFGESLERAEMWVERLRILGLQRAAAHQNREQQQSIADVPQLLSASATASPPSVHQPLALPRPASFSKSRTPTATTDTTDSSASTPTLESSFSFLQQSVSSAATTEHSPPALAGARHASGAEPMDAEDVVVGSPAGSSTGRVRKDRKWEASPESDDDGEGAAGVAGDRTRDRGKKSRVGSVDGGSLGLQVAQDAPPLPAVTGEIEESEMRESP